MEFIPDVIVYKNEVYVTVYEHKGGVYISNLASSYFLTENCEDSVNSTRKID